MANRILKQIELLAPVVNDKDLVNKEYVDNALNARLQEGVKVVLDTDFDAVYDLDALTLTQNVGSPLVIDGIQLEEGDELLYVGANDKTQNGRYEVTTIGAGAVPSTGSISLGVTNTGVVTEGDISFTLSTFESKVGTPTTGSYIFSYDGVTDNSFKLSGSVVDIADYGISIASESPADGDTITVSYTEAVIGTPSVITRSEKMNKSSQLFNGLLIPVHVGDIYKDSIFQLVSPDKTTIVLDTDSLIFEKYKGANEGAKKYTEIITGDDTGTAKVFQITHGLGTKDIEVVIYDNTTDEKCYFGVKAISDNAIEISSDVALGVDDEFRVVVIG